MDLKSTVLFFFSKALLMKDPQSILIQQTENVQSARQVRFTRTSEIQKLKVVLKQYIFEAIEIEKAGLKVPLKKFTELKFAEEFEIILKKNKKLKTAFEALTPGRQRAYN